ncbi:late embryogenesis abundant protein At1g64065-like [Mangifera indica]|uniref:late embryogenesis abundant protein At1g64065-like n=1 Tax=Mangifera indica TaxID=29780 RepID=UPI001CF94D89|nr:late embryogenesis abundant protein At1g64065-like [Mangifera indica]
MKQENYQMVPWAPPKRDEELYAPGKPFRKQKSSKCLVYFLVLIVSLGAIALIFASIFLRTKTPKVEIKSVVVSNLSHGIANSSSSSWFNATLVAELTLENKNFGSFEFQNGSGNFFHCSVTVGDMKIGKGRVKARKRKMMKLRVELRSNLTSDINSGLLKLSCHAKLQGRVKLFDFVEKKESPEMNCCMSLNLTSHAAQDLVCN